MTVAHQSLFRLRQGHAKVTNIELFFDLVFVFAVTQLSHTLLKDLSVIGVIQTSLLFIAVWWVWINTSWVTNWLDPDKLPVRLLLLTLMLLGLMLSASLPHAFDTKAIVFAGVYVLMQNGRSLFMLFASRKEGELMCRNFQRISLWMLLSGCFWIAGSVQTEGTRLLIW